MHLASQKLTLRFFRAYLDKTNGYFGILTTAIDIFLDWYNNKQRQETMARRVDKGVKTGTNRRNANERSGRDKRGKLTAYVYSLHVFG